MLVRGEGFVRSAAAVPGALPAFGSAGAPTSALLAGTKTIAHPATVGAGNLLLCAAIGRNNDGDAALAMHASMSGAGWQHITGSPVGPGTTATFVAWKYPALGSEGGTNIPGGIVATGGATSDVFLGCCVRFTAANLFATVPHEDASVNTGLALDTSQEMPTITPTGLRRLGVNIFFLRNDLLTLGNATGASGGSWSEVLDIELALGSQVTIQIQVVDLSGGGAISGGNTTSAIAVGGHRYAFALVPADV